VLLYVIDCHSEFYGVELRVLGGGETDDNLYCVVVSAFDAGVVYGEIAFLENSGEFDVIFTRHV
jgi:hypothetical protein